MEPAQAKITKTFTLRDVEWRYQMRDGILELQFAGVTLQCQIEAGLQIDHAPINIHIEVPIYAKP